jgi:hypothetical protein
MWGIRMRSTSPPVVLVFDGILFDFFNTARGVGGRNLENAAQSIEIIRKTLPQTGAMWVRYALSRGADVVLPGASAALLPAAHFAGDFSELNIADRRCGPSEQNRAITGENGG